jgi:hypothetical protein
MAKFIAKGTVLVEKKFELEVEASSKIAAKQEIDAQVKSEGYTLKEVSFEEITEESVTNEEAQQMVESGEAEVPTESIIKTESMTDEEYVDTKQALEESGAEFSEVEIKEE